MPGIGFEHVSKTFASGGAAAVHDVTLEIPEGELVVLLGPSGCGKTTLLRMVNRLIEPSAGRITVGDREVHDISATDLRRHIGYVIQQVGLFPHMTVEQNVAVVPGLLGWSQARIRERIDALLDLVDLPPERYRRRYPRQLSGGQQQRVGIARAMAADPAILLMDEPFGAIDAITRADLQDELLRIQGQVRKTIVFVTHDVEEALKLADRIAVMREGEIVQYDTPLALLSHPADDFVAALLGAGDILREMSLIPVTAVMEPREGSPVDPSLPASATMRDALSRLIGSGAGELTIVDGDGRTLGRVTLPALVAAVAHPDDLIAQIQS